MKLIFVVKCSYGCQETTISNPPESLGGGPLFARVKIWPRARIFENLKILFFVFLVELGIKIRVF